MPDDIGPVWDGKPYVPDDKLKEEISSAWSGDASVNCLG